MDHKTKTNTAVNFIRLPKDQLPTSSGNKYFILSPGKTFKPKEDIIGRVLEQISGLKVATVEECDAILVFCFIVSRTGKDIDAALNELNDFSESKPAVFIVLHHTFNREKIVPDSSTYVSRENTLTMDCLFNEDEGLLDCVRNEEALTRICHGLQPQDKEISTFNESDLIIASELKLVLLGMSVCEKTAVEHMILGRQESRCDTSPAPLMKITVDTGEVDGEHVAVINTPDFWFSSEVSHEEIKQKIQLCMGLFSHGPCVLLVVIPVKQFPQKEREMLKKLDNTYSNRLIVFTATNEQEEQEIQKHDLKPFEPFHVLNISQIKNRSQVSELLKMVEIIVKGSYVCEISKTQIEKAIEKSNQLSVEEVNYVKVTTTLQRTAWIALKPSKPYEPFVMVDYP